MFKFNPIQELNFVSPDYINVQPSDWNATIYVKKTKFALLNKISLTLYNKTGEIITERESELKLFNIWEEKTITIKGRIIEPVEFKSIKIRVYGFSIKEKINILYGSEKASNISFYFSI